MNPSTLQALAAACGDKLSYEAAELICEHGRAVYALAGYYQFRKLEMHPANS